MITIRFRDANLDCVGSQINHTPQDGSGAGLREGFGLGGRRHFQVQFPGDGRDGGDETGGDVFVREFGCCAIGVSWEWPIASGCQRMTYSHLFMRIATDCNKRLKKL